MICMAADHGFIYCHAFIRMIKDHKWKAYQPKAPVIYHGYSYKRGHEQFPFYSWVLVMARLQWL